jgi:protein-L-isoaspartate(D-aspartate) O-methyltransferase
MRKPPIKLVCYCLLICFVVPSFVFAADHYKAKRAALVELIKDDVELTANYLNKRELDPRVIRAMATVPRHEFVPPPERANAYLNRPVPIGYGQTISQPYIVAIMTDLLQPAATDRVLEIGTGSAYQAAILAELVADVYTMEIVEPLAKQAKGLLNRLDYNNVQVKHADGYYGWPVHAPFDAIIVTAAASHIPPPLLKQLKPGGRMIIPVGSRFLTQELLLVEKTKDGDLTTRQIMPVIFVPLTGGH